MRRTLLVLLAGLVALATPAGAAQMDPTVAPKASGPITLSNESYEGRSCTRTLYRKAVVSKTCRFFHRFDPAAETDAENDYGAWWFQTRFRMRDGWCLKEAETTVSMPQGFAATDWSEKDRYVRRKRVRTVARLASTAGGAAEETARLEAPFILRKGHYINRWRNADTAMKMRWRGRMTRHKVAFAGGFAGSWPAAEGPQPFVVTGGPTYARC